MSRGALILAAILWAAAYLALCRWMPEPDNTPPVTAGNTVTGGK